MTDKSEKEGSRSLTTSTTSTSNNGAPVLKRGRGRPPGSKNKPKVPQATQPEVKFKTKRKYTKRSKAAEKAAPRKKITRAKKSSSLKVSKKPAKLVKIPSAQKTGKAKPGTVVPQTPVSESPPQVDLTKHPLFIAAKWLEKNMHHTELQYYRSRANKKGTPISVALVSDMLGFYNVQKSDIDKQVLKNNLIVNYTNGIHPKTK